MAAPVSAPSKEDVVAEFRRRSIIQAACHVFGEKGFEPATVDAIEGSAEFAQITTGLWTQLRDMQSFRPQTGDSAEESAA